MNFDRLDELAAQLRAMRPLNETELKRLRDEFVVEHTYDSNAIEGNTLTLRETALILQEGLTIAEKPIKDHLEAIGYRDAFEYIVTLADAGTSLSERAIKEIHSLVLMNDRQNRGERNGKRPEGNPPRRSCRFNQSFRRKNLCNAQTDKSGG